MGTEIEAKIRLRDTAPLVSRLESLGARRGAAVIETNAYFDTPQCELRASDRGLRVRVETIEGGRSAKTIITYKGPRGEGPLKIREEIELEVADASAASRLLEALGFRSAMSFEKRRCKWEHGGCHVDIDTLPYLGDFVEIEGPSEQAVLKVRDELGLGDQPIVEDSYIAMLDAYLREHHIATGHVALG